MEQKSKKSGEIRVVSFADNFIKLVFFNMTFERFVNGKIIKLIKVIARYNRALFFKRKIIFFKSADFFYYQRPVPYKGIDEYSAKKIRELYKKSC